MSDQVILEDMMGQLGEFGRYQLFQHALHLMASFFAGIHMLSLTFTAPTPRHRCYVPSIDGKKPKYDSDFKINETVNKEIMSEKILKDGSIFPQPPPDKFNMPRCEYYKTSGNKSTKTKCNSFVYEFTDYYPSSLVVQYDMVCDDRYKKPLLRTIYLFGVLHGVIFLGPLADKTGRKPIYCISALLQVIFGIGLGFVGNYWLHLGILFLHGIFASGGAYVTAFVLTMELVPISKRTIYGTNFSASFTSGTMLLVLSAYLIFNAMYLQIALGAYSAIMLGNWWFCDESIRWLWGVGRRKEAIRIAQKAARWNRLPFEDRYSNLPTTNVTPNVADKVVESEEAVLEDAAVVADAVVADAVVADQARAPEKEQYGLLDMFKYPRLRLRLLLVAFNWFANSIVYYGISFNTEDLSGNPYLNFFWSALAEVPGFIVVDAFVPYTGSRTLMALTLGFGGAMCYVVVALTKGLAVTVVSVVAKIGIAVSFTIVYNYTAELFPTVARNSALGFCSMAARLAGMITPMLGLTDDFDARIPAIIFGTVAILGAFFCAFLPETLHQEMPQTMDDGENFRVGDTAFNVCCPKVMYSLCGGGGEKKKMSMGPDTGAELVERSSDIAPETESGMVGASQDTMADTSA